MRHLKLFIGVLSLLSGLAVAAQSTSSLPTNTSTREPLIVKYVGNNLGLWESYYLELIDTALKSTANEGLYRIDFVEESLSATRKREMLVAGNRINIDRITGFGSKNNSHQGLLRVKVPLMRGFHGFRIPLIRKELQARLNHVNSANELRQFSLGLGRGWEGYIYKKENFTVIEAQDMSSLLKMLAAGRFDFIPLAATEIEDNYSIHNKPLAALAAENRLLIYMPMPIFFYVSEKTPELANRMERGLLIMEKEGKMKSIFDKYFAERLKKLHLSQRVIIEIPNFEDDGSIGKMNTNFLKEY